MLKIAVKISNYKSHGRLCKPTRAIFCVKSDSVLATGVFGESVSVMEGDSVVLHTDVTEIHKNDDIQWIFGAENILIAEINTEVGFFNMSDVLDGRFRDRLKLNKQTGSLTITNITTQHSGDYKLEISGVKLSSKTFSVSVCRKYSLFIKYITKMITQITPLIINIL
ncbi:Signal-regulatory protein beta-1 isoform 3 [Labeo rohita]|uniref:Signal-regulatory protein beta-1 isoform 3 n=1 Tax=Labeo rohita TaxID=84645 RepID=A0ABQ8LJB0_LABRO|nr:Signal-regulatory protein beta-1 isoform 3 [Labeo rohita]